MSKLIGIEPTTERFINVVWITSNLCNYKCSYCHENNYGGSDINISEHYIENSKKLVEDIFKTYSQKGYKWIRFYFGGGEPTYWKPFNKFLEFIQEKGKTSLFEEISIGVNTNLSSNLDWWESHWKYFDHMSASFHIEQTDKDKFIKNLKFLQDKFDITVRLMMLDDKFQEVIDFGEHIKQELNKYDIEYVPLLDELSNRGKLIEYNEKWKQSFFLSKLSNTQSVDGPVQNKSKEFSLTAIYDTGKETLELNKILQNHETKFRGWTCHVEDLISVMSNGEVSDVTCGQGHFLGNLNKGPIKLRTESVLCDKEFCHCGAEIMLPKFIGASPLLKP